MSKEFDLINKPEHYNSGTMETIDVIAHVTIGVEGVHAVCVGNIVKYISRANHKNGVEDIKKAKAYLLMLKERHDFDERLVRTKSVMLQQGFNREIWECITESHHGTKAYPFLVDFVSCLRNIILGQYDVEEYYRSAEQCLDYVIYYTEVAENE